MSSREKVGVWIESTRIQGIIIGLILVNAVTLGLETSSSIMASYGGFLHLIDRVILAAFVAEMLLKLFAHGRGFFRRGWNLFDFTVIAIALIPASGPLAVLRALRVLRVLRLVSVSPRLRFVVEALLKALPGIASIASLMLLLFYVAAVIATGLFGTGFPEWFGTLGGSMYTLFQIMTLESWSMGIVRPVMEVYPYAWLFFIPFILIATFTMLNLFIGIIVDTMQTLHDDQHAAERERIEETVHQDTRHVEIEVRALREEIEGLRRDLAIRGKQS
ncbi:ion transporter [Thiocapsa bogorovii]|uniref:ion transporter n=1 Tax=Thiocapsa bogorovii TaxID=521689 RepID=UPI001E529581|nr:ion transporter [Thiocapsa bogorovii]UHD17346.1 ion transporter [Thiocapsa bogorovii]